MLCTHARSNPLQEDQLPGLSDEELQRLEQQLRTEQMRRQQVATAQAVAAAEAQMRARVERDMYERMTVEQENRDEERQCAICLDADKNCAFNCGHQSCLGCAETL